MKSDEVYLARICDAIDRIRRATDGRNEEAFSTDERAVVLWLMQIGEISKRLSEETKVRIDAPWKQIAGFRDVAVHDYFNLSVRDVWHTATEDIPALHDMLNCRSEITK